MLTGPDVSHRVTDRIKVDAESGCWEWQGARHPAGHGRLDVDGEHWYAHRLSYVLFVGELSPGQIVHHVCENPPCCNPAHLSAVDRKAHAAEHGLTGAAAVHAAATACSKGHPFDGHDGRQRTCRICARARNRAYEARRRRAA